MSRDAFVLDSEDKASLGTTDASTTSGSCDEEGCRLWASIIKMRNITLVTEKSHRLGLLLGFTGALCIVDGGVCVTALLALDGDTL